jgi:hypothetical protein
MTNPQQSSIRPPPPPTRTNRSNIFAANSNNIRYPPRIPRLIRRPLVHRDIDGNIIVDTNRPSSISSAISMTREYTVARMNNNSGLNDFQQQQQYYNNEKAVDLATTFRNQIDVQDTPSNTNYVPLKFEIISEDGGRYSSTYSVENILRNDGTVYWLVFFL